MHDSQWKKVLVFLFLGFIFFRTFFLRLYWQSPYYFRKKSPRNPKHRTLFPVTFFPRTWENSEFFSKVFISFFQKLFFQRLCYMDSYNIQCTLLYTLYQCTRKYDTLLIILVKICFSARNPLQIMYWQKIKYTLSRYYTFLPSRTTRSRWRIGFTANIRKRNY